MEIDITHTNNLLLTYKYDIFNIFKLVKYLTLNNLFNSCKIEENLKDDIISSILIFFLYNKEKNLKVQYFLSDKRLIINNKLITYKKVSNIQKILKIIILHLIDYQIKLKPFWNDNCLNISNQLWLPTNDNKNTINYTNFSITEITNNLNNDDFKNSDFFTKFKINPVDIDLINNNIKQIKEKNKELNKKKIEEHIQNGKKGLPTTLINEDKILYENEVMRTRQIRIYPNKEQINIFKNWFGTCRTIYNKVLYRYKHTEQDKPNLSNFISLRNNYITYKSKNNETNRNIEKWELDVPKDVRAETLRDLSKSFNITLNNLKNNKIHHFNMKYRKKKDNQSIVIPNTAIKYIIEQDKKNDNQKNPKFKSLYIYNSYIKDKIRYCKKDFNKNKKFFLKNNRFIYDTRLIKKNNKYYISVIYKIEKINNEVSNNIVSLDPGFRTFQTAYSNNKVIEYNINKEKISNIIKRIDNLNRLSLINSGYNSKKRNNFKRIISRLEERKKNIMKNSHYYIINDLIKDFDTIILPNFENQEIQKKIQNKKVRREVNIYSHYTFKCRLKDKLNLYFNKQLVNTTEEFTSKTCTNCGNIDNNLGAKKIYHCDKCNMTLDRDYNGARNIFIKSFL